MEVVLMALPKKSLFGSNVPFRTQSGAAGSAVRIVLQFCPMKGAKRDREIILLVRAIWSFWPKNGMASS